MNSKVILSNHVSKVPDSIRARILDVFDLQGKHLHFLNRRISVNENSPIDDHFGDDSPSVIHCCLREDSHHVSGSYVIHISSKKIRLNCSDLSGLFYALNTFVQLLTLFNLDGLPSVVISGKY